MGIDIERRVFSFAQKHPKARKFISGLNNEFYAQKYRFDLGVQFLVFVNFALLVITASDKMKPYLDKISPAFNDTAFQVIVLVPLSLVGVYLFGYLLDVLVHMQAKQEIQQGKRSPLWQRDYEQQERIIADQQKILAELDSMRRKLE